MQGYIRDAGLFAGAHRLLRSPWHRLMNNSQLRVQSY
jgi:hypothetical protein